MKIEEIIVSAGRTFNHPYESYANLKPQVTLKATLEDGEDASAATKQLQAMAEKLVEEHKFLMLAEIKRMRALSEAESRFYDLQHELTRAQGEMEQLKRRFPEFAQLPLPDGDKENEDESER